MAISLHFRLSNEQWTTTCTQSLADVTFLMNCERNFFADLHFFSLSVMVVITQYLFPIWERNYLKHVNFWFALLDALDNIIMEKAAFTVQISKT